MKGVYLPSLLLLCAFAVLRVRALGAPRRLAAGLVLALAPIALQLALSVAIAGNPSISSAGGLNFNVRYFPAVYGFAVSDEFVSYKNPVAAEAGEKYPSTGEKVLFIARHLPAKLEADAFLYRENVAAASAFVDSPREVVGDMDFAQTLKRTSGRVNTALSVVHLIFLPLILLTSWSERNTGMWWFYCGSAFLGYSVLFSSMLSYWQGDRLVVAALPVWAVLYPAVAVALYRAARPATPST